MPSEHLVIDAPRRQPAAHLSGLSSGFRPEPVVYGQGCYPTATAGHPRLGEQTQRHAIGAPGDGHAQVGRGLERAEGGHQSGKLFRPERP